MTPPARPGAPPLFQFSLFGSHHETQAETLTATWEELVSLLTSHEEGPKDGPCFAPTVFHGGRRAAAHAIGTDLICADLDSSPQADIEALTQNLARMGLTYALYSTHSWDGEDPFKCRIVIPLASRLALDPQTGKRALRAILEHVGLGAVVDPKTIDLARLYYLPRHAPGFPFAVDVFEGAPLDPTPFAVLAAPRAPQGPSAPAYSHTALRKFLEQRIKKGWAHNGIDIEGPATAVLNGDRFAAPGQRDEILFAICSAIGAHFYDAPTQNLARIFDASLQAMAGDADPITPALVEDKIKRAQDRRLGELEAEETADEIERRQRIRAAFARVDIDRETPWTQEEFDRIPPNEHIIHANGKYYFYMGDRYSRGRSPQDVWGDAKLYLAPSEPHGITYFKITDQGKRPLRPDELLSQYGSAAERETRYSYLRPYTTFENGRIVESVRPENTFAPKHHPHVDRWLRAFAGKQYDALSAWLWLFPQLDKPCPVLILHDAPGTGKNVLCMALAKMVGRQTYTRLNGFYRASGFNDDILYSPLLVLSDEEAAVDDLSEKVKDLVTAKEHTIQRKYGKVADILEVCLRVILCSNNVKQIFKGRRETPEGLKALAERFVDIEQVGGRATTHPAASVLLGYAQETKDAMISHEIAEHVLWIGAQFKEEPAPSARFKIPTGFSRTVEDALLNKEGGLRWEIFEGLYEILAEPPARGRIAGAGKVRGAIVRDGTLWVSPTRFVTSSLEGRVKNPRAAAEEVREILRDASGELREPRHFREGNRQDRYYPLETAVLMDWAEGQGLDTSNITEGLKRDGGEEGTRPATVTPIR